MSSAILPTVSYTHLLMPILVVMRDIRVIAFAACPLIELTLVTKFRDKVDLSLIHI